MSEIRFITGGEYGLARNVWDICFPEDAGAYAEYYFAKRTAPENVIGAFEGKEMLACLHVIPQRIRVGGESLSVGLIAGVGVLPQYRKQGLAGRMLALAKDSLKARGAYGAMLQPVNTAYYVSSGFAAYSVKDVYELRQGEGAFDGGASARDLLDIYSGYAAAYDGMRERSLHDMELLMEEWRLTGCEVAVKGGAYMAYYVKDGMARCAEAAGRDIGKLARALAAEYGGVRCELPQGADGPGNKVGERVFSMMARLQRGRESREICSLEYC